MGSYYNYPKEYDASKLDHIDGFVLFTLKLFNATRNMPMWCSAKLMKQNMVKQVKAIEFEIEEFSRRCGNIDDMCATELELIRWEK